MDNLDLTIDGFNNMTSTPKEDIDKQEAFEMSLRIKQLFSICGISQSHASRITGITQQAINNYCNAERLPVLRFVTRLYKEYRNINIDWFLLGEGNMLKDGGVINNINVAKGSVVGNTNYGNGSSFSANDNESALKAENEILKDENERLRRDYDRAMDMLELSMKK